MSPTDAIVALVVGAVVCSIAPLLVYSLSLALFGLAHVASEMRYVDRRFGSRVGRGLALACVLLLSGLVVERGLSVAGALPAAIPRHLFEAGLLVALAFSALPALARVGGRPLKVGLAASVALALGVLVSPMGTLLFVAVAHNITPIGFALEAADDEERPLVLSGALTAYLGVPLLIALGLPHLLLEPLGIVARDASVLPTGPLSDHLGAYLPRVFHSRAWADQAFAGVVFAQLMHYVGVIWVLPRAQARHEDGPGWFPWPRPRVFFAGVVVLSVVLLAYFTVGFARARSVYGVAAAVHAWVEVPLLLLALVPFSGESTRRRAAPP
jgi:hypothetical protein